ncbi:hypothetical protein OH77DRAFT_1423567 [Trametes cingulata]|nr:hypothetical protein OH77DRAFT_1423567 [Trametes cingulata]
MAVDRYTSIPLRTRATSQDRVSARTGPPETRGVARSDLLDKLISSIADENKAVESLLLTFGLHDELSLEALPARCSDPKLASPPAMLPQSNGLWSDTVEIVDKKQYLLTPIRTKIFPKASPGVLRSLLSTPSLRACTPEQSILPEDSSLLGSPLQKLVVSGLSDASESMLCTQDAPHASPVSELSTSPCHAPRFFLPSPPPSTELPSLESFRLLSPGTEPSPGGRLDHGDAKRPEPSWDARRSSQGPRWPFSELISSGLRAAPCSPLLTTRAVVQDSSTPLSSVPTARAKRASDPRMLQDRGLAFGVVRDFQRVVDELQGLGHESSLSESGPIPLTLTHAPDPPLTAGASALGLQCGACAKQHASDCALVVCSSPPQPGWLDAPLGLLPFDNHCSGGSGQAQTHPLAPASSGSFDGLEDEFISLLLGQALEEEIQAEQLRHIANKLEDVAKRKKRLAKAMTERQF